MDCDVAGTLAGLTHKIAALFVQILKMDPGHSQAHLMQARICLEREHFRAASACLDQALSHDFSIRQSLSYFIIKARILENAGDVRDALQTLQAAMKMLNSSSTSGGAAGGPSHRRKTDKLGGASVPEVSLFDKASVYIQMAQVLSQLNDIAEATKIVREALQVFRCVLWSFVSRCLALVSRYAVLLTHILELTAIQRNHARSARTGRE